MINELTINNFEESIKNDKIVILEFYTPTCSHCKKLFSTINKISNENNNEDVIFAKIDVTKEFELQAKYEITSVPTLLFIKGGEIKNKLIGEVHPLIIEEEIKKLKA